MNKAFAYTVGFLILASLVLFSMTYTVRFNEVAVRTTFGKTSTASVKTEPGIHFRFPLFADRVTTYDTRVQLTETALVEAPTADGQSVVVRTFLMWRMDTDPQGVLDFVGSYESERAADAALRNHLLTAAKASLGRYSFDDLIGPDSKLAAAEQDIRRQLESVVSTQGITPVTVGISQVQLPTKITKAVLSRMQATRTKLAETERTAGAAERNRIISTANTIVINLRAFAQQRAEQIKGEAQQKAARYLQDMSQDEDFAIFQVYLDTLRAGLNDTTTLILSDGVEPWHLLNPANVNGDGPIPKPPSRKARSDEEPAVNPAASQGQ